MKEMEEVKCGRLNNCGGNLLFQMPIGSMYDIFAYIWLIFRGNDPPEN